MKERIKEILEREQEGFGLPILFIDKLATYLAEQGCIVAKFKDGQEVWFLYCSAGKWVIDKGKIFGYRKGGYVTIDRYEIFYKPLFLPEQDIEVREEYIFSTKAEAEAALKEMR